MHGLGISMGCLYKLLTKTLCVLLAKHFLKIHSLSCIVNKINVYLAKSKNKINVESIKRNVVQDETLSPTLSKFASARM